MNFVILHRLSSIGEFNGESFLVRFQFPVLFLFQLHHCRALTVVGVTISLNRRQMY